MAIEYKLSYTATEINERLGKIDNLVASVNGITPDESGNVEITIPDSGGNANQGTGWTNEQINLLDELFSHVHFSSAEGGTIADNLIASLRGEAVKTIVSISATYSGGEVEAGTELTALAGIVVTATYDDGSTKTVTGYTLSGTIAEGENTITVSYSGKTATFTVTGTANSGGEEEPEVTTYTVTNNLTNVVNSSSLASVTEGESYTAVLTAADGYELNTVTVTMGGVDVTSTVYLDGTISIAMVSGDIVITATAKGLPVNVPMTSRYNDRQNTIIYADDGTEKLEERICTMVLSEDVFTEDTEVTVTIETNAAMYSKMYGACYLPGIDITTVATEKPFYHAELLFDAWNDVGEAGTYIKTYTVKAGYGLAIVNPANSVAPVTAVTVTA